MKGKPQVTHGSMFANRLIGLLTGRGPKTVTNEVYEITGRWGHIRVERTSRDDGNVCLYAVANDTGFDPHESVPVIINEDQWRELVKVVPKLMGWAK